MLNGACWSLLQFSGSAVACNAVKQLQERQVNCLYAGEIVWSQIINGPFLTGAGCASQRQPINRGRLSPP